MTTAKHIKATGEEIEITPANGTDFSLKEVQAFVGGYVEAIYLPNDLLMLCNEEGKLKDLPMNEKASAIFYASGNRTDYVVGDVVICSLSQFK